MARFLIRTLTALCERRLGASGCAFAGDLAELVERNEITDQEIIYSCVRLLLEDWIRNCLRYLRFFVPLAASWLVVHATDQDLAPVVSRLIAEDETSYGAWRLAIELIGFALGAWFAGALGERKYAGRSVVILWLVFVVPAALVTANNPELCPWSWWLQWTFLVTFAMAAGALLAGDKDNLKAIAS